MSELWLSFPELVVSERQNTIIFMLKRALREPYRLIKLTTTASIFKLLEEFAVSKNPAAPFLYKTLVFNLVESPQDLTLREMFFTNFTWLFKAQPSIPIALLVEPLMKQLEVQFPSGQWSLKTFDYDFFLFLTQHTKFGEHLASLTF